MSKHLPVILCLVVVLCVCRSVGVFAQNGRYERVVSTAAGHPEWIELGPSSIAPSDRYNQSGAIESVLADPSNPPRVFIGSVNGGIWRTNLGRQLLLRRDIAGSAGA